MKNANELTIKEAVKEMEDAKLRYNEIADLLNIDKLHEHSGIEKLNHPMIGTKCLVRTYSAGVHIGDVVWIDPSNPMSIKIENSLRLWKWEGGGLSLSAVANNGIKRGRLNKTGDICLTNAIEFIPTTEKAEKTYVEFIED